MVKVRKSENDKAAASGSNIQRSGGHWLSAYILDPTEALVGGITETEKACGPNIVAGMEAILGLAKPTGKLPVAIPVYENGRFTEEIRFPRGYGLSVS